MPNNTAVDGLPVQNFGPLTGPFRTASDGGPTNTVALEWEDHLVSFSARAGVGQHPFHDAVHR